MQSTRTANKRYNLTPADSTVSFMFLIAWTAASVVKVQIKADFKLTSYKVSNIRGQYTILEVRQITMKAGQTLHFTKSGMDNMYYLTSTEGCTCKAGRFRQPCHHVEDVATFIESHKPIAEVVTSEVTTCQINVEGMLIPAKATVYRIGGHAVYEDTHFQCWFCSCGGEHPRTGCEHISHVQSLVACIASEQAA